MAVVSLYDVLGVTGEADLDEIKRAYYDRARLYHPDAHAASPPTVRAEAERTMQALNQAWSVLRDEARRRRYDRSLAVDGTADEASARRAARPRRTSTATNAGTGGRTRPAAARTDRRVGNDGDATRSATRPGAPPARRPTLGVGFQYWFGAAGSGRRGERPSLNLRVTGTTLAPLRSLLPDGLSTLHAEHTPIDDVELRNLQGMRSLRAVDLTGTRVTDAGLVHLLACQGLETLVLWDTAVTDSALALVGRLPNLCHLGLGNTAVTDAGLEHLARLPRLRLLQLSGTEVDGPGLRHLHGLPELMTVALPWKVRGRHRRRLRHALPRGAQIL